jgi:hypothetical protein
MDTIGAEVYPLNVSLEFINQAGLLKRYLKQDKSFIILTHDGGLQTSDTTNFIEET